MRPLLSFTLVGGIVLLAQAVHTGLWDGLLFAVPGGVFIGVYSAFLKLEEAC